MAARFHAPGTYGPGTIVTLSAEEAQHATRVLRLGPGAPVRLFDGEGHEFDARIVDAGKSTVRVEIGQAVRPAPEARVPVTLVQSVLKGDKMDDVVRDAVMMGAAAIQPVVTEHSETSLIALARGARRERWQRVAVASAKQCGRAVVPPIAEPAHLTRALAAPAGVFPVMCVEPGLPAGGSPVSQLPATAPAHVSVLVGPEGGWGADEVARHADVAYLLTLGGRTLRADAVALVALTALFAHWREV